MKSLVARGARALAQLARAEIGLSQGSARPRWGEQGGREMSFFQRLFTARATRSANHDSNHAEVIKHTAEMVRDGGARSLARKHKLEILDLTWEDTGRFKGSCVGPNISDMTIQVANGTQVTCMPVIR